MEYIIKLLKILIRIQKIYIQILKIFCIVGCFTVPLLDNAIIRTYLTSLGIMFFLALIPVTFKNTLKLEERDWCIFQSAPNLTVYFASWISIIEMIPIIVALLYPIEDIFLIVSILLSLYVLLMLKVVHADSALEDFIKMESEKSIFS